MPKSFASVMSNKKNGRRRSDVLVCFSPDMAEEYQALLIEASDARIREERRAADGQPVVARVGSEPESTSKFKAAQALVQANEDSFYWLKFEQLRDTDWLSLRSAHAARDGNADDGGRYNMETFPRAAVEASMLDPEPDPETLAYFDENLSRGEWKRLAVEVWNLNEGTRQLPKAQELLSAIPESASTP